MDVDASLTILGDFGWFQWATFVTLAANACTMSWHLVGVAFTLGEPGGYSCRLPPNDTADGPDGGTYLAERCSLVYEGGDPDGDNVSMPCIYGWEYDSQHETSFVTDLDLVCDRAILAGTLTSVHYGGSLVSGYILGQLSDIFGRRPVIFGTSVGVAVTGIAISFTWSYGWMVFLRFLNGALISGPLMVGYVRLIEMFPPSRRLKGQLSTELFWVLGLLIFVPLSYLLPNWRHLQLAMSLGSASILPFIWFMFESVRWLVQKGRIEEAEKILQKIAKSKNISHPGYFLLSQGDPDEKNGNKVAHPESVELDTKPAVTNGETDSSEPAEKALAEEAKESEPDQETSSGSAPDKKTTVLDLFKTPALVIRTLMVFYCWFVCNVVYHGFFINSSYLVGNKYLNFFLICLTEAPSYIMNYFLMNRFGRKRPLILFYVISGVACIVTGALPAKTASGTDLTAVSMVCAMIGKFFSTATFDIIFLVTAEVYPTVLRNTAIGTASLFGRAGAMLAPFIVLLNVYHRSIPLVVFGVMSLLAGVMAIPLPETHNCPLPETLADGVKMVKGGGTAGGGSSDDVVSPTNV